MTRSRHHSADFKCLQIKFDRSRSARTITSTNTMEWDEKSPPHWHQCPSGSAVGRRNVEVNREESSSDRVELTMGVKTSKPKMLVELSSGLCEDIEAFRCRNGLFESPPPLRLSPATAPAQTQMPSPKPKARMLVACRQLTDRNEAASLKDQSPLPLLTLKGTVSLASTDPRRPSSVHASITGKASVSTAQLQEARRLNGRSASVTREHIDTMQYTMWGMPGCGAPNYHLGTVKRTKSLNDAGILPQEQTSDKGSSGTLFQRL
ncbi:uncharacterized protein LOC116672279 isoform X2 [Etheostoma spectabile]|uniref:uncharacterized protein LOC116672279 isoform X2 n=1 Tax=Etheostoma spectabile TaxID=54343 RepID=UPI0013AFC39B|nr:uncharacterized protein LOC116672279 isoform X2 [Etheostoma spectabile]